VEPTSEQKLRGTIFRPHRGGNVRSHGREPVERDVLLYDSEPAQRATCDIANIMPPRWGSKYIGRIFSHTLTGVAATLHSLCELSGDRIPSIKFIA
jgi:hypothetical protein